MSGQAKRLRLGRLVTSTPVGDDVLLVDPVGLGRVVLAPELASFARRLRTPTTPEEFAGGAPPGTDAAALLALLRTRGLVVDDDTDDEADAAALLSTCADGAGPPVSAAERYWQPAPLRPAGFTRTPGEGPREVRVLLVGTCVLEFARDALAAAGLAHGMVVEVRHRWLDAGTDLHRAVEEWDPHVTVLAPTTMAFTTGLWDDGPLRPPEVRERRVRSLTRLLERWVDDLAAALGDRLGLVHNFAPAATSPYGRTEFRVRANSRWVVSEVNRALDTAVGRHPGLMLVDEERLAARHGAATLFDDLQFPYAHHGGRADATVTRPHQVGPLSALLAEEYLACYRLHRGIGRIKCIVTDLDGTLWPGNVADDGLAAMDEDTTTAWVHRGYQQALRLMTARGVLLASASKGTREVTLAAWSAAPGMLVTPDDFVAHLIDWNHKSDNVDGLCRRLGIAPSAVLVLDDNPVERAEIQARLPGVTVLDAPVHEFRAHLLSDPRLEVPAITAEAAGRTESSRAVLARDELAATTDPAGFLRELAVVMTVADATEADLPRVGELVARTTQFTTTGPAVDAVDLSRRLREPGSRVIVLRVTDRFADYGLVGVLVAAGRRIEALVLSCRVIGLDVAAAFVATALEHTGLARDGVRAGVVVTPRNEPARDIYERTGFTREGEGEYRLPAGAVPRGGASPHRIVVELAVDAVDTPRVAPAPEREEA